MATFAVLIPFTSARASGPDARAIIANDPSAGKLLEVPFIAQERFQCGPASVAMVIQYHGAQADPDEIARRFETENVAGTFTIDLLIAASAAGLEAHWQEGNPDRLRAEIDQGRPAIVFLNLAPNPIPQRHFAVAVGHLSYKKKNFFVLHSGGRQYLAVPERTFLKQWKRTGNLFMTADRPKTNGNGPDPDANSDPPARPRG